MDSWDEDGALPDPNLLPRPTAIGFPPDPRFESEAYVQSYLEHQLPRITARGFILLVDAELPYFTRTASGTRWVRVLDASTRVARLTECARQGLGLDP